MTFNLSDKAFKNHALSINEHSKRMRTEKLFCVEEKKIYIQRTFFQLGTSWGFLFFSPFLRNQFGVHLTFTMYSRGAATYVLSSWCCGESTKRIMKKVEIPSLFAKKNCSIYAAVLLKSVNRKTLQNSLVGRERERESVWKLQSGLRKLSTTTTTLMVDNTHTHSPQNPIKKSNH